MKEIFNKQFLKELSFIIIFGLLINLFCVFLFFFPSHAASDQDYFPMYQNHNGKFSDDLKQEIATRFDATNNYVFVKFDNFNPSSGYGRYNYHVFYFPKSTNGMMYAEKYTNLYQFSFYLSDSFTYTQGTFWCDARQPNTIASVSTNNVNYIVQWMVDDYSSNYDSSTDYVSNFQIMTNNTSSAQIVLLYDDGVSIPEGDTARDDMEIPDINDYIPDWTNSPSFDNSSVESALESVYDGILWLGGNIKDTISGTGKYIGDVVRWGLQRVIDTIRDKIDDIKNAINEKLTTIQGFISDVKAYVYEVKQYIEYIKQPLDQGIIYNNISNTSLVSNINTVQTSLTSFQAAFTGVSEPLSYTIPIHLENLPSNWFGTQTTQYIDLGVINGTVKDGLRLFVWAMVTYSLVVTIFDSISNYINGGGDES